MTVSLIIPVKNEASRVASHLQDLESFWRRIGLSLEVILVMDPSKDETEKEISRYQQRQDHRPWTLRLLKNEKSLGRSGSVIEGLRQAKGDVILISSMGWSTPLTELFQALQEFQLQPQLEMLIGNRQSAKKKRTAQRSSWYWTLEAMLSEKLRRENLSAQDLLTPFIGLTKSARDKIIAQLEPRGWFYTPELLRAARRHELRTKEINILSQDREPSKIPLLREYLRNIF
jgi:hypothetical protein